jgi:hypothetical protein
MDEVVGKVEDVRESSCRASNSERDSDGNEGPAACESSSLFGSQKKKKKKFESVRLPCLCSISSFFTHAAVFFFYKSTQVLGSPSSFSDGDNHLFLLNMVFFST